MNLRGVLAALACVHQRENSSVAGYSDLRFQVDRWAEQTGRRFTYAERAELVEYLDAVHYQLDRRPRKR